MSYYSIHHLLATIYLLRIFSLSLATLSSNLVSSTTSTTRLSGCSGWCCSSSCSQLTQIYFHNLPDKVCCCPPWRWPWWRPRSRGAWRGSPRPPAASPPWPPPGGTAAAGTSSSSWCAIRNTLSNTHYASYCAQPTEAFLVFISTLSPSFYSSSLLRHPLPLPPTAPESNQ